MLVKIFERLSGRSQWFDGELEIAGRVTFSSCCQTHTLTHTHTHTHTQSVTNCVAYDAFYP